MRPFPSLNGWMSVRFRCAMAAATGAGASLAVICASVSVTSDSTNSRSGASYTTSPLLLRTHTAPGRQRPGCLLKSYCIIMKCSDSRSEALMSGALRAICRTQVMASR